MHILSQTFSESIIDSLVLNSNLSFKEYIARCQANIIEKRKDLKNKENSQLILSANAPFEMLPNKEVMLARKKKFGALLIHGLLDSPFSLRDVAFSLASHGILSRAVLLPGHGTEPSDLLHVDFRQWVDTVAYGLESLLQEVDNVYLIGYSTGAALSLYHALKQNNIAGIILLAPAIKIKTPVDFVVAWHKMRKRNHFNKEWIYQEAEDDYAKYQSIAFNPVLQVSKLIDTVRGLQQNHSIECPMLMIISREDEIISSDRAINFFTSYKHPESKLLLYTSYKHAHMDLRILPRATHYPKLNIKHFSHIAIPFAPNNIHYGQQGDYPYASHLHPNFVYGAYNRIEERAFEILYKYNLVKIRRRTLTYNPDFDFMSQEILKFIFR